MTHFQRITSSVVTNRLGAKCHKKKSDGGQKVLRDRLKNCCFNLLMGFVDYNRRIEYRQTYPLKINKLALMWEYGFAYYGLLLHATTSKQ